MGLASHSVSQSTGQARKEKRFWATARNRGRVPSQVSCRLKPLPKRKAARAAACNLWQQPLPSVLASRTLTPPNRSTPFSQTAQVHCFAVKRRARVIPCGVWLGWSGRVPAKNTSSVGAPPPQVDPQQQTSARQQRLSMTAAAADKECAGPGRGEPALLRTAGGLCACACACNEGGGGILLTPTWRHSTYPHLPLTDRSTPLHTLPPKPRARAAQNTAVCLERR